MTPPQLLWWRRPCMVQCKLRRWLNDQIIPHMQATRCHNLDYHLLVYDIHNLYVTMVHYSLLVNLNSLDNSYQPSIMLRAAYETDTITVYILSKEIIGHGLM